MKSLALTLITCLVSIPLAGCRPETATPPLVTDANPAVVLIEDKDAVNEAAVKLEIFVSEADSSTDPTFESSFEIKPGATLEQVMRAMDQPEIEITGSGVTAFVQSIDGVSTGATRGWTFTIDGTFATVGIGSIELEPGQSVQWRFTSFEEAMEKE